MDLGFPAAANLVFFADIRLKAALFGTPALAKAAMFVDE